VFSGVGNCMGGVLVLSRCSPLYDELKPLMEAQYDPALAEADAATLLRNSRDLPARLRTIAANAATLVGFLKAHPMVRRVYAAEGAPPVPPRPCARRANAGAGSAGWDGRAVVGGAGEAGTGPGLL
jgi:cystathionine beta-lyase/cystathionine gamma-synthase